MFDKWKNPYFRFEFEENPNKWNLKLVSILFSRHLYYENKQENYENYAKLRLKHVSNWEDHTVQPQHAGLQVDNSQSNQSSNAKEEAKHHGRRA